MYSGRATDEPHAYAYQVVEVVGPAAVPPPLAPQQRGLAIIGYAVDEGVRLNQGRTGAADGPAALRERLGREPWHAPPELRVVDLGDIHHEDGRALFDTLLALALRVEAARRAGYRTVVLGGGHDLAAGHYLGLHRAGRSDGDAAAPRIGIVNFDAHLDLRPVGEAGPTSGTPFSLAAQLNAQHGEPLRYCCVGAQRGGNTRGLLARAAELGAEVVPLEDVAAGASTRLAAFAKACDALYVTVDLDGFPAAVSPGVSAPGVEGLAVATVRRLLGEVVATGKVIGFDVAECNPVYDLDDRTARLGARLIAEAARLLGAGG